MKPKMTTTTKTINSIVVSVAIVCFARQVSSWQMLEPFGLPAGQQQQQQTLQAPANTFSSPSFALIGSELRPNQNEASQQQTQSQQQAAPAPTSMAGKILDSLVTNTLAAAAATTTLKEANLNSSGTKPVADGNKSSLTATKAAANIVSNMLKPRKSSDLATKDIEQQIIQQHARAHHQFLTPSKKFAGSSSSSSSPFVAESDGRDSSALSSILDNFKSGITSRSSIVKAISDNKLARTLTDVGKTIGGNKYVAGAAAASALAALGLAVSKIITPYMFAGSFSGPETLMSSGSSSAESYLNPSRLSFGDYPSSLSPTMDFTPSSYSSPYSSNLGPQQFTTYTQVEQQQPTRAPYLDTAGSSAQATFYSPGVFMQSPLAGPNGKPEQFFIYRPKSSQSSSVGSSIQRQQQQQPQGDVNGHYTDYYNNQPIDLNQQSYSQLDPIGATSSNYNTNEQQQQQQQQSTSAYNQRPEYSYSSQQQRQQASGDFINSADQLAGDASVGVASYAPYQQQATPNQLVTRSHQPARSPSASSRSNQTTGRRYGPLRLKLDSADKAMERSIVKVPRLKEVQFAMPTFVRAENYHPHAGDKSAFVVATSPSSVSSLVSSNSDIRSGKSSSSSSSNQQQQQENSLMPLSAGKDQGQATLQVSSNTNNNNNAFNIIRPNSPVGRQMTSGDKLEADRRHSSSSAWVSIPQQTQQAASGHNSIHHQEAAASSSALTSNQADSNGQQERFFRTTTTTTKGLDYDLAPPQADSFGIGADKAYLEQVSGDQAATGKQQQANEQSAYNVIKATNTRGGKLAGQPLRQQQSSQLESSSSSSSSSGGLSLMPTPMQLQVRPSHNGHATSDQALADEPAESDEESNNEQTTQRRGQSAASSARGKSDSEETSSSSLSSSAS